MDKEYTVKAVVSDVEEIRVTAKNEREALKKVQNLEKVVMVISVKLTNES